MPFPYDTGDQDAIDNLAGFYNGNDYDAGTNAGGLADGGHRVNFVPALQDVARVGEAIADAADYAATQATAAASSASSASTSASTASTQATNASNSAAAAAASAAGILKFNFNTATSGDPGSGKFRFDNATFGSATKVAFNETDANSNNLANLFSGLDNGSGTNKILVLLSKVGGSAYFSFFVTSALTDQGSYVEFNITPIETGGSISNADGFLATFIPLEKGDTGATGSTGSTGAAGADGANQGNKYTFNSATSGDPGSGKFLLDNATLASAATLHISETDGDGGTIALLLAAIDNSTSSNRALFVFRNAAGTKGITGYITAALSDQGSYDTFAWTPVTSWGSPANNDVMFLSISVVGDKGDTGATGSTGSTGAAGANGGNKYTFNSGTSGDPGSGKYLFNNATFASVTAMNISETDGDGGAVASWLATLDDSTSTVKTTCVFKSADGTKGFVVNITGTITDNGSYDTFSVTPVVTWGSISNNDAFYLSTSRTGDKGDTGASGAGSGDLLSTNNLSDVANAATAFANIKQAATTSATGVVELATTAEAGTGTDTSRAVVPSGLFPDVADVASASTTDLGAITSSLVRITGTTTITAFGTIAAGIRKTVRFAAALTLTHNATALILIGGANITTAAGDIAEFVSEGAGNWRCLRYTRADGRTLLAASATQSGDVELATVAEAATGTDTVRAVTPAGLFPAEATVASAGTTNIGAATTTKVQITGATTITAFDSVAAGIYREGRFAGALTFTHNATSLIIPGGANITTAANDRFGALSLGSGNWIVLWYQKASGKAVIPPGADELTSGTLPDGRLSSAATPYGRQAIYIPATAMVPATTNGPASGSVETTTNKVMLSTLDFDTTTAEIAQFSIAMPKQWNEGTVTFKAVWSHASTATNFGVAWDLSGVAFSDDDAQDTAFGTVQTVTDTGGTTNDAYVTAESSAITIAGTPAAEDLVYFRIRRAPSNGSDTLAIDARLHGIILYITTDAGNDT